jgi:4-amino-4-deoxy-L-arabinose transferase-like glycosyltransferase
MLQRANFIWLLLGLLTLRLISSIWMPLSAASEPRYAEIARLMMESKDWITPWFEPGVPFWGKPPLSFWTQALSFSLFGVNEFAARLPSLMATLGTVWILWQLAFATGLRSVAQNTVIIYLTGSLVYIAAGAVLTDPFLVLGTTWAMAAFYLAPGNPVWYWRYGFFLGLAIGLLAKGPLALVLVFGPALLWSMLSQDARPHLKALPWATGGLLTLSISLPWYVLAELKTPGFLDYFVVGEHFMRFVDADWQGDLYGHAHARAKGMIWVQWLMSSFPWGVMAIALAVFSLLKKERRIALKDALKNQENSYLLLWSLFTPVFFTAAGNILWTYVLPALPAFSLLLARALERKTSNPPIFNKVASALPYLVPLAALVVTFYAVVKPDVLDTEKGLIAYVAEQSNNSRVFTEDTETIYYLRSKLPFSARFYSHGTARLITLDELNEHLVESRKINLAIRKSDLSRLEEKMLFPMRKRYENKRYVLVDFESTGQSASK